MDSELHTSEEALEYDPSIQEHQMDEGVRELLGFLIRQGQRTGKPLSVHAYTDRAHLRETIRSNLAPLIPPKYGKAADLLYDRIEKLADPVLIDAHPTALVRMVINISDKPVVDRLTPDAPVAYALLNIEDGVVRHRAVLAKDVWGIDPELSNVPAGAAILIQPADPPPTDRSTQENKPGGNFYMFNHSEMNDMAEERAEQARRLMPYSGISPETSEGHGGAAEEAIEGGLLAETFLERQNRENEEFFKRRREDGDRFRREQDRGTAFFENKKREQEDFFRKGEDAERRRRTQEYETRIREDIEADNAVSEAIARLEATFGLIHERELEINEHPHASSELAVLGGEVAALRGFLASGRGSAALRARAAIDVQKASGLGAEFRLLRHDETATAIEIATSTEGADAIEQRAEAAREATAIALVETELARVRADEWEERLNPQESPEVAALRAAEAGLAGMPGEGLLGARAGEDFELGREALGEAMQSETPAQAKLARTEELQEPAKATVAAQKDRLAASADAQAERAKAGAEAQQARAEISPKGAEEGAALLADAGQEAMAERARLAGESAAARTEEITKTEGKRAEATQQIGEEQTQAAEEVTAGEPQAGGGELALEAAEIAGRQGEVPTTVVAAPGPEAAALPEIGQQPSESGGPHIVRDEIEGHMIESAQEEIAQPIQQLQAITQPAEETAQAAGRPEEMPAQPPAPEVPQQPETQPSEPQPAEVPQQPNTPSQPERPAEAPPPSETQTAGEPVQPSEGGEAHHVRDAVEEHIIETAAAGAIQPVSTPEQAVAPEESPPPSPAGAATAPAVVNESRVSPETTSADGSKDQATEPTQLSEGGEGHPMRGTVEEHIIETAAFTATPQAENPPAETVADRATKADQATKNVPLENAAAYAVREHEAAEAARAQVMDQPGRRSGSALPNTVSRKASPLPTHPIEEADWPAPLPSARKPSVTPRAPPHGKSAAKAERELEHVRAVRKRTGFVAEHDGRETEGLRRLQKAAIKRARPAGKIAPRRAMQKPPPLVKTEKPVKAKSFTPVRKPLANKPPALSPPPRLIQKQSMPGKRRQPAAVVRPPVKTARMPRTRGPVVRTPPRVAASKKSVPAVAAALKKNASKRRPGSGPDPQSEPE